MKDLELYQKIQEFRARGVDVALLSIVETRGSTPQKAGAKMAVLPDGNSFGTIGGGCVEAKAKSDALKALLENQSGCVATIHLNAEAGEEGDVCGGTVVVLIEYLPGTKRVEPP